ncbi:class I SAM-dependent methyltransferase [Naasia sp. SYSU D00948]|uniref:class I SAM-dependent methyltransferase n=1 Tax=Naasia sp. SYSU D00948 TaxID=2817379 RepID=UPI001B304FF0|nr:methyltransferase domain-containing protein [Naasia sp. SYSU D00948]
MQHERYVHGHHESVLRSHTWRTVENSAAYLLPHLRPGLHVLDLGSGPGTITVDLAERVAPGEVVGVDAAAEIVEAARRLGEERGLRNVSFRTGNAYALDLPDDSVDIAHAHQVLQHVADPVAVLREMARVVKPGGLVAARDVDYGGTIWYPELPGMADWIRIYDAVHRGGGGEPNAGRRLGAWALAAGLADVTTSASIWGFSSPEERSWWGGLWADRALKSDFARQALEGGFAQQEDLDRISAAWREWAEHPDAWFAFPHGEVLARV